MPYCLIVNCVLTTQVRLCTKPPSTRDLPASLHLNLWQPGRRIEGLQGSSQELAGTACQASSTVTAWSPPQPADCSWPAPAACDLEAARVGATLPWSAVCSSAWEQPPLARQAR